MGFVYLTERMVSEVHRALVAADLTHDTSIKALTSNIPPDFIGTQQDGGSPSARTLLLIRTLNTTRSLADGDKPLLKFLANAITLSGGTDHTSVFLRALAVARIEIDLPHQGPIEIKPGQEAWFSVEVYNNGPRERTVTLAVDSDSLSPVCELDVTMITLKPQIRQVVRVTVRPSTTKPVAGRHLLWIAATESQVEPDICWKAGPNTVIVAPTPQAVLVSLPATGIAETGNNYQVPLKIVNTGNDRITGTLCIDPARSGPHVVDSIDARAIPRVDVAVDEEQTVSISVAIDSWATRDRTWSVPLRLENSQDDSFLPLGDATFVQRGVAAPVIAWLERAKSVKNKYLLMGAAAMLVAGFTIRGLASPSDGGREVASTVDGIGANTLTTASTTTAVAAADTDPVRYEPLDCAPGQFVSMVATIDGDTEADTDAHTAIVWRYIRSSVQIPQPPVQLGGTTVSDTVRSARWSSFCLVTARSHSPTFSGSTPRNVIVLGPFNSKADAIHGCSILEDISKWKDCYVQPL